MIVIADNCADRTAAVARAAGAEVWERTDSLRRGKGHALAWAFTRLLDDESVDAACVVDADCEVSRNLLTAVAARLHNGADAVQVPYLIANPESSAATALRWAGFALFNVVRPLGRDRLGLSTGLLGTGMAFSRRLLLRAPWSAFSFAEDREQHMRWVLGGARVVFAPEAEVSSPSPSTGAGTRAQERRWESGRGALARGLTPRLLARSLRTKDPVQLDAALEPMLPPQSLLLTLNIAGLASARLAGARGVSRWAAASLLAQATYVIGGLAVVRAPAPVWRAFASLPRFLARRIGILASWHGADRRVGADAARPRGGRVQAVAGRNPPGRQARRGVCEGRCGPPCVDARSVNAGEACTSGEAPMSRAGGLPASRVFSCRASSLDTSCASPCFLSRRRLRDRRPRRRRRLRCRSTTRSRTRSEARRHHAVPVLLAVELLEYTGRAQRAARARLAGSRFGSDGLGQAGARRQVRALDQCDQQRRHDRHRAGEPADGGGGAQPPSRPGPDLGLERGAAAVVGAAVARRQRPCRVAAEHEHDVGVLPAPRRNDGWEAEWGGAMKSVSTNPGVYQPGAWPASSPTGDGAGPASMWTADQRGGG